MELKFNKNGDAWVAEFEATDKFNLHMEGLLLGSFSILQRTAGGKYTHVRGIPTYPRFDKVFDYDFDALVYPKFIKIVSETEPTYAEVVSDGEITEIKSQTKEVEVTANGTTQVAPDAGYSYLTGVTVKTNVPQSGGSGGGNGDGKWLYLDKSSVPFPNAMEMLVLLSTIGKVSGPNGTIIGPIAYAGEAAGEGGTILALGFDLSQEWNIDGARTNVLDFSASQGAPLGDLISFGITKEEFYSLEGGNN